MWIGGVRRPGRGFGYGRDLLARAEDLARRHGLGPRNPLIPNKTPTGEELAAGQRASDAEHRVDVVYSADRGCMCRAERGHLPYAYWQEREVDRWP